MTHLIFQQYEERLRRRQSAASTIKNLRRTAELFSESNLDPLTAEDWQIEEWLAELRNAKNGQPLAPRTKRMHMENLSAVYNYAVTRRMLQVAPTESVRLPREPDKEPRILENAELRELLGNAENPQHHMMLMLLIYTGMRRNELRSLRWENVTLESLTVIGKGDKLRHIPVHPALAEEIIATKPVSEYLIYGPRRRMLTQSGIYSRLEQVKAGMIDCTFHDFRRTVATSLAENDVPEGIIDKIMGWSPRTVQSRYYVRRADARLQEAILRLYSSDPIWEESSSRAAVVA